MAEFRRTVFPLHPLCGEPSDITLGSYGGWRKGTAVATRLAEFYQDRAARVSSPAAKNSSTAAIAWSSPTP